MNETIKSGWKTTEFWVSLATSIFGVLVTTGVFTPEQAGDLVSSVGQIAGGLITVVASAAYAISRAKTKATPTNSK